jgi:hypothetical protein
MRRPPVSVLISRPIALKLVQIARALENFEIYRAHGGYLFEIYLKLKFQKLSPTIYLQIKKHKKKNISISRAKLLIANKCNVIRYSNLWLTIANSSDAID